MMAVIAASIAAVAYLIGHAVNQASVNRDIAALHARIDCRARVTPSPYPSIPVILREIAEAPYAAPITGGIHKLVDLAGVS